jgi:hypothetical protein
MVLPSCSYLQWKWSKWSGNCLDFLFTSYVCPVILNAFTLNLSLHLQSNEKSLQRWLDHELEVMVNVHEVRFEYEKQSQVYALNSIFGNSHLLYNLLS